MEFVSWTPIPTISVTAAILFLYLVGSTTHQWYRLRKVPGPFLARISYLWIMWVVGTAKGGDFYQDLSRKYGRLVRIGPNTILTSDAEVLRRMSGARSHYGKDGSYRSSLKHPDHDTMFATTNIAKHSEMKSKMAGPYGGRETKNMENIVDNMVEMLLHHIRETASPSLSGPSTIDLSKVSLYFALDVITRLAFGGELGFLRTDSDVHNLMAGTKVAVKLNSPTLVVPWLGSITTSSVFLKTLGPKSTDQTGLGVLIRICEKAVKERYQPGAPDSKDLLGAFVRQGIPEGLCLSEAMFAIAAGSETIATAIRGTMLHLMTTPRVYYRLKRTVSQAVSAGIVSSPIKHEEARRLPYIQAIIYEGLRMRPPVPTMFPKVVPPQGDIIDGIHIPGGTSVGWNLLPIMRSPEYWGADADLFRPERFSEADETTRISMERLVELVFGYGKFACAGKPLAFMELNKVFFELFRHFDFQLVNPAKPWDSELRTVWLEENFFVQVAESCAS